ncbi:Tripeptide aminopeptidase [Mucinivorans hirudinis]|uniref:Peptidase T n=1 Tax=Mucinivorans hirudinis TaxID=1433126 RepID=A0A060R9Z6_9BACT|nr:Tripeptide aminopeptidase [Mucinivorans hirudinis]
MRYVAFDTQSDPKSETYPSSAKQLALLNHLLEEMLAIGMTEVEIDEHGYVMGTLPATKGKDNEDVIGFIAHVDTAPDMSGANVKPIITQNYDGCDILLNEQYRLSPVEFPELKALQGHTIISTDGTTLLGADDKAGIAEILTAIEYLIENPEIEHGKIRVGFTPDEEIGAGVDYFNVEKFGAIYGYTVDGSVEGELEYENFNAASAKIVIAGRNIHPGYAKGKMINALHLAMELNTMLPFADKPEHTEGYEGFYHLTQMSGTVENATMEYIIRDHSSEKFEQRKVFMTEVVKLLNARFDEPRITLTLKDQYYNMRKMVEPHPAIIERAVRAMELAGVKPLIKPIRGGTDGSRLSYMGLPCPNIFTGGANFHGRFEYISLDTMERAVQTIINIIAVR